MAQTQEADAEAQDGDGTAAEQEARAPAAKDGAKTYKRRLLVGRDLWTKAACSFLVQCKGIGDATIVDKVARWMDALDYRQIVPKTDGEPALIAVQEAIAKARTHDIVCRNPPGYDPQANGMAERASGEVKA